MCKENFVVQYQEIIQKQDKIIKLIQKISTSDNVEEIKELGEELKRTFNDKCKHEEKSQVSTTIKDMNIEAYNYVTRDEFEMLKARVYKVESMLNDEKK